MTIRIKNWSKHQHFKDRSPPWIKLYKDILDDPDWHELDGDTSKTLVALWLLASEDPNRNGELPEARKIAFRLRISENKLKQQLTKLSNWLEQDDITVISERYQVDAPETEAETKGEAEKETEAEVISSIFDYWKSVLNKSSIAKLTSDRKEKVRARLNEGYTPEDIKKAIDGCSRSKFHMGSNPEGKKHDCLTLICRNGSYLEKFIGFTEVNEAAKTGNKINFDEIDYNEGTEGFNV